MFVFNFDGFDLILGGQLIKLDNPRRKLSEFLFLSTSVNTTFNLLCINEEVNLIGQEFGNIVSFNCQEHMSLYVHCVIIK